MKQVTQTLKTGAIDIKEVPVPTLSDGFILVKNTASIISAGTEKTKIDMGKKNLLQKAKARPDLVKQVVKKLQTEGIKKTIQTVRSRLESPSPLGYSCAGKVISSGGLVEGIQPGDRVACGGADYANHADYVAVPKNLVVKIPENVSDNEAAFTTVGSIAMQGLRLAEPKLGEVFVVLGLGLIGQIMVQLLKANGCQVIATDLDESLAQRAATNYGAIPVGPKDDLNRICLDLTAGHGVDGVLVCAGSSSNQPIETCGAITREKGRVVVVGAVRMDIPREDYFKKEISVVISRSYGPGRYDPFYEENGNDYPYGYVRFTEKRNMESFLALLSSGSIEVESLITHRFKLEEAEKAYQIIEGHKKEPYLGILLEYDKSTELSPASKRRISFDSDPLPNSSIRLSFLGAGNYATASLLPPLKSMSNIKFNGLATASGRTAQGVAEQFGFQFCTSEYLELLTNETDAVVITTRHDTHAQSVVQALENNKHTYVEKPLALTLEELYLINKAYEKSDKAQVMVGFNRRFSPLTKAVNEHFSNIKSPLAVNIRVNAGEIPEDHWIQDPEIGGGRIIGEGCHFIDLASALTGSAPCRVHAFAVHSDSKTTLTNDNLVIQLTFDNGSIANITYVSNGSKAMNKEYVEVFGGGKSAIINDFKEAELFSGDNTVSRNKLSTQDKGQSNMLSSWVNSLTSGKPCIEYEVLMRNSIAVISAVESISIGMPIDISTSILNDENI